MFLSICRLSLSLLRYKKEMGCDYYINTLLEITVSDIFGQEYDKPIYYLLLSSKEGYTYEYLYDLDSDSDDKVYETEKENRIKEFLVVKKEPIPIFNNKSQWINDNVKEKYMQKIIYYFHHEIFHPYDSEEENNKLNKINVFESGYIQSVRKIEQRHWNHY